MKFLAKSIIPSLVHACSFENFECQTDRNCQNTDLEMSRSFGLQVSRRAVIDSRSLFHFEKCNRSLLTAGHNSGRKAWRSDGVGSRRCIRNTRSSIHHSMKLVIRNIASELSEHFDLLQAYL
ncbi:hypothetical protein AVEN_42882-1 [Araneus ventricosus]|uniref:Uncharacterized protein n=1 Tax=Araneus ventricosus TaxID=182803 RepID=A0A4Y2AF57_ARAVE|nr:hypothetical protein AVEN_42882-1 [Araneus ventricosus]